MSDSPDQSPPPTAVGGRLSRIWKLVLARLRWVFGIVFLGCLMAAVGYCPKSFVPCFDRLLEQLPAALPLLSIALSVGLGATELSTVEGLLRRTKELSLGLVSFATWYLVAAQSLPPNQQYIKISSDKYLNKDYAPLVVVSAFIWVSFCSVVRERTQAGAHDELAAREKLREKNFGWYIFSAVLLACSCALLVVPFRLSISKTQVEEKMSRYVDKNMFLVTIPYIDTAFNAKIVQCHALTIVAKDAAEAKTKALKDFQTDAEHGAGSRQRNFVLKNEFIVAEERAPASLTLPELATSSEESNSSADLPSISVSPPRRPRERAPNQQ